MNNSEVKFEELNFNGFLIQLTQSTGFDMMINATEMARPFGPNKRPAFWLRSKDAQEYINALVKQSTVQNLHSTDMVKSDVQFSQITPVLTIEGHYSDGTRPGTWMHRWVAIRYAQWLNPEFAVWIDMKIDELLQTGFTTALQEERDKYSQFLQGVQSKIDYCNNVLTNSEILYSTEQICKDLELGISSKSLLSKLENLGIVYRRNDGKWFLSSNYDNFGYLKTTTIIDKKTKKPRNIRRWTESGKYWIWSLKNKL